MNNIDDMMVMWKEMDGKLSSLVEENRRLTDEIKKNKLQNSQEKLMRRYKVFIVLEALCIPLIILIIGFNPLVVEKYRIVTLICWILFFLGEVGIDSYLLYRTYNIDIYGDSIVEISKKARKNWKIHKIAVLVGLPIAIGIVILFILAMGGNMEIMYGVIVGLTIGLIIGLNQLFKFMKNYKEMTPNE